MVIAICLMFISTIGSSIQPIYAASSARINPDDMLTVLNDITVAGQSWENIGFDSEDIANIKIKYIFVKICCVICITISL